MYDEAWEIFRAECIQFAKEQKDAIIKNWLKKIKYDEPVGYYFDYSNATVEIYATRLGMLIGKEGIYIKYLEDMAHEAFPWKSWKVKLIEVRGGFVGV